MAPRIGVASIMQETNTFAVSTTAFTDFDASGILRGQEVLGLLRANTEAGGALERLAERNATPIPVLRASTIPGGPVTVQCIAQLCDLLEIELMRAVPLDGLVLSLHGAFVDETAESADVQLLERALAVVGPACPVGVCLDLHAHVTATLIELAAFVIGYRTYPHIDQAATGARAADLLLDLLEGRRIPVTRLAKRPFLSNPEAQGAEGPLGELRRSADALVTLNHDLIDVSLFPVQPWLDAPGLGYAVTVTSDGEPERATEIAEALAEDAWDRRRDFVVELAEPEMAIARVRRRSRRPQLLTESADAPPGGAGGDSPAMIRAFLEHGADLHSFVTLVDRYAVDACVSAGVGNRVSVRLGCSIDQRFHEPIDVTGIVGHVGAGSYPLTGPVSTGLKVTMGRYARLEVGNLTILVTERPAVTFDPETFRQAGMLPENADVIVVRSANLFRAGWGKLAEDAVTLDLPGATSPRLSALDYRRVPRPLYPLDDV